MSLILMPPGAARHASPVNILIRTVDLVCRAACQIALVVMVSVVAIEVFLRSVLDTSLYMSHEVSAYMLVALTFMGLATCHLNDRFHRVEAVLDRLTPKGRIAFRVAFDAVGIAFSLLLFIKYFEFVGNSWHRGNLAPTLLATPLWIPQASMLIGMGMYLFANVLTLIVHIGQLGAAGEGASNEL